MKIDDKRYLISLDCDGTLLTPEGKLTAPTIATLRALQAKGHIIVIASGRPERAIKPFYQKIGLKSPYIAYNGALVKNPEDEDFPTVRKTISYSFVQDLLKAIPEKNFRQIAFEDDVDLFYLRHNVATEKLVNPHGMSVHYGTLMDALIYQLNFFLFVLKDEALKKSIAAKVATYPDIGIRFWYESPLTGEFYFKDSTKADAIARVAHIYGIKKNHVISFGDASNDIEMISQAGIGIAMSNGSRDLKKYADMISVADNAHDGVSATLRSLFGKLN
jgi:5-amino-6-(5-phospho-D-ribitylamino)uracil phosphatase